MSDILRTNVDNVNQFTNRGLDTKTEETSTISISLLDIDTTIILYIQKVIQLYVVQDDTKVLVPVLYATPERWKNIRQDGVYRDKTGKLQIPLVVIKRQIMKKNSLNNPVNKYLEKNFTSTAWNDRNKYDRFALQNGIEESKRYVSVMYPDFYDLTYECVVWTEYQEQMNALIEQISFETENYWGEKDKYKFKTSVSEYTNSIELPEKSDRLVRVEFTMTVKAYLLPNSTIDKHGNPTNTNNTRFTNKKLIITETII